MATAFGCLIIGNADRPHRLNKLHHHLTAAGVEVPQPRTPDARGTDLAANHCYGTSRPSLSCDAISAQAAIDQASAADRQAAAVWWQFGVGAFTLAAAVAAAIYARNAALHTERGANEARRSADAAEQSLAAATLASTAELRPWIKASVEIRSIQFLPEKIALSVSVAFENIGSTVAKRVATHVSAKITGDVLDEGLHDREFARIHGMMSRDGVNLIPGDATESRSETWQSVSHAPWSGNPLAINFMIFAVATYESDLAGHRHVNEQSFNIGKRGGDIFTGRLLLRGMEGCSIDDIVVCRSQSGEVS